MLATVLKRTIALFACCASLAAFAEAPSTLKGKISKQKELNLENIYFDFGSAYHGPMLNDFGPYSVNNRGKLDKSAFSGFDNEANLAYVYNREREEAIGIDLPFSNEPNFPGKAFEMGDIGLKWFRHNTVATDSLIISTDAYLQAPTSQDSQDVHMKWAFDTTPYVIYNVPGTRWRLGLWTEFRYRNGVDQGYISKVYGAPYAAYRVTDKFWLQMLAESRADHNVGDKAMAFHNYRTDVQPGFIWRITPNVKINPHLQIYPDNPLALDQISIACSLYARIL